MEKTNAMRILDRAKIGYRVHEYGGGALSGAEVARALGEDPSRTYKTLVTVGSPRKYYVFAIPVDKELDLKKAATAAREKSVSMLPQRELFPLTGYVHGGCSPIGMKKTFPTFFQQGAETQTVIFSAGKIGFQLELPFSELSKAVSVTTADLVRD